MTSLTGIGWWSPEGSGRMLSGGHGAAVGREVFSTEFRNFGRLDADSRAAAYAAALALEDAGLAYPLMPGLRAGIVGSSALGCLQADLRYFRDYVECGRTLGRGNYFIYTLPTSPLAECSIHFGLEGPALYAGGPAPLQRALELAAEAIEDAQADMMLSGGIWEGSALFMVLLRTAEGGLTVAEANDTLRGAASFDEARARLENIITKRRGTGSAV